MDLRKGPSLPASQTNERLKYHRQERGVLIVVVGRSNCRRGRALVAKFLSSLNINPVRTARTIARVLEPVRFGRFDGTLDAGYDLSLLPAVWRLVREADRASHVPVRQRHVAALCRRLLDSITAFTLLAKAEHDTPPTRPVLAQEPAFVAASSQRKRR